jgi:precorrin-4 methylase
MILYYVCIRIYLKVKIIEHVRDKVLRGANPNNCPVRFYNLEIIL